MGLELIGAKRKKVYREFEGDLRKQLPLMLRQGFFPLSAQSVIENRLNSPHPAAWREHYFHTGDLIACNGGAQYKIILTSDAQGNLTSQGMALLERLSCYRGASSEFFLTKKEYESLKGPGVFTFSRESDWLLNKDLEIPKESAHHAIRRALVGHTLEPGEPFVTESALLREYDLAMAVQMKAEFNRTKGFGVGVPEPVGKPRLGLWRVDGLLVGASVCGEYDLDAQGGRLIGVRA